MQSKQLQGSFLQLNMTSSKCVDICVDPLYGFVVKVEDEMRRLCGNACNRAFKVPQPDDQDV